MRYLLSLIFSVFAFVAFGQTRLQVTRASAVERNLPVNNLFVDADNNKWVANDKGVSQLLAYNLAKPLEIAPGKQSLLSLPGGNANIDWSADAFNGMLAGIGLTQRDITAAHWVESNNELWLGTAETGLLQVSLSGTPRLIKQHQSTNSKLRSDAINSIFEDQRRRLWIGTKDGVLVGKDNNWDLIERYFNIEGFAQKDGKVWMFGDGFIGPVSEKLEWSPVELPEEALEGYLEDFIFDWDGNVWLASEIIARYNFETEALLTFGGAEYYTSSFPIQIEVDLDGAVWVSTLDKGLFVIEEATALNVSCFQLAGVSCEGDGKDAAVKVEVAGGEAPFTYEWSNGSTTATLEGIPGGIYRVQVTDSKGQVKSADIEVIDPRINVQAQQLAEESVPGAADGRATVLVGGTSKDYEISWSTGAKTAELSGLSAGMYEVTVSNEQGCSEVATVAVKLKTALLQATLELLQPNDCEGAATAVVEATVSGGKAPYQLNWEGRNATGARLEGLAAGTYTLWVRDAEGTEIETGIEITDPSALGAEITVLSSAGLGQSNGAASVKASGGTPDYTFLWDNGTRSDEVRGLSSGLHQVTITDSKGCSQVTEVEIPENILPMSLAFDQEQRIVCAGEPTAVLSVKVNGGKGPMTFAWSDAAVNQARREKLGAGTYAVTVTDALGTATEGSFEIKEPEPMEAQVAILNPAVFGEANGKAEVNASGGTPPYTVTWDNGVRETQALRLTAGAHQVSVTDKNNCLLSVDFVVPENVLPLAATITEVAANDCAGGKNIALKVNVSGGKGPYKINWGQEGVSGFSPKGLAAGTYNATITDAEGSTLISSIEAIDPDPVQISIRGVVPASTDASDGKASVSASGGTGNYTFAWDNGETASSVSNLAPGEHRVTVMDASGCATTTSVTIAENILPLVLDLNLLTPVVCMGDASASIAAKVSGGKKPYAVKWSNGSIGESISGLQAGRYSATVTDASDQEITRSLEIRDAPLLEVNAEQSNLASANQADGTAVVEVNGGVPPYNYTWNTGSTSATLSGLAPGAFKVTVTDAAGCRKESSVTIVENILPLALSLQIEDALACSGDENGRISAQVSGGKSPFTFTWSNGSNAEELSGLAAGEYNVTISDVAGQSTSQSVVLTEPEPLTLEIADESPANTSQSDGMAEVAANGGTAPYTFAWSNGTAGARAENLAPGTYEVSLVDANGCQTEKSIVITEDIKPLTARIALLKLIDCAGNENAAVRLLKEGGKAPFAYQWNKEGLEGTELKNLGAGEYVVTVTDASGQETTAEIKILEPRPLEVTVIETRSVTTPEEADGKAQIQIGGGTGPFKIRWENGEQALLATRLQKGANKVVVTDGRGCEATAEANIAERILTELTPSSLRPGQTIRMRSLEFEADSSRITPESVPVLEELFGFLKDNQQIAVEIGGHTNNIPTHEYCDSLSTARAKAIAEYIVKKGIPADRVQYYGYGKRNPIFSNQTEDGRQRNQRVEIKILRTTSP